MLFTVVRLPTGYHIIQIPVTSSATIQHTPHDTRDAAFTAAQVQGLQLYEPNRLSELALKCIKLLAAKNDQSPNELAAQLGCGAKGIGPMVRAINNVQRCRMMGEGTKKTVHLGD